MESISEAGNKDCEWLRPIWEYYGKKQEFDLEVNQWLGEYPDLLKLLKGMKNTQLEAWPNLESGHSDKDCTMPAAFRVRLSPMTLARFWETAHRQPVRQITVNGKRHDLRNGRNYEVAISAIEDLAVTAECWMHNLNDLNPRKRNASERFLQTTLNLRGRELEERYPELYRRIRDTLTNPTPSVL
jgi:hypothetical protein